MVYARIKIYHFFVKTLWYAFVKISNGWKFLLLVKKVPQCHPHSLPPPVSMYYLCLVNIYWKNICLFFCLLVFFLINNYNSKILIEKNDRLNMSFVYKKTCTIHLWKIIIIMPCVCVLSEIITNKEKHGFIERSLWRTA